MIPIVKYTLLRLIHLADIDEGAEKLADILQAHLELDGLWPYIRDNLVGLITDGDAVGYHI